MSRNNEALTIGVDNFREILKKGQTLTLKVKGNSMWPFLKNNQIISVVSADFNSIAKGEILFTFFKDVFFCHRLFIKKDNYIITKGDTMLGFDPEFSKEQLLGKVIAKMSNGKAILLDTSRTRFFGVAISWLTLIISPLYPLCRLIRRLILKIFK